MTKLTSIALIGCTVVFGSIAVYATHNSPESVEARVSAIGQLNVSEENSASSGTAEGPADGKSVYNTACGACHGAGIGGAPTLGDSAVWGPRTDQGFETLVEHAISGFQGSTGVMPAKGGNPSLSDDAVTAAVQYMVDQSR